MTTPGENTAKNAGAKNAGAKSGMSCLLIGAVVAVGGICVIGVLSVVAIPAFINYVKRAKTAEAAPHLKTMFTAAAVYYAQERLVDGRVVQHCTVDPAITSNIPGNHKTMLARPYPASFDALGLDFPDPIYYRYEIIAPPGRCGHGPSENNVYTLRAYGDLDADGVLSTFEISVGSNQSIELYRAPGIYVVNELE